MLSLTLERHQRTRGIPNRKQPCPFKLFQNYVQPSSWSFEINGRACSRRVLRVPPASSLGSLDTTCVHSPPLHPRPPSLPVSLRSVGRRPLRSL